QAFLERARELFVQRTGDPARSPLLGLQSLDDLRQQQAASLAYFDVFWLGAGLAAAPVVLVLLMQRSVAEKGERTVGGAHRARGDQEDEREVDHQRHEQVERRAPQAGQELWQQQEGQQQPPVDGSPARGGSGSTHPSSVHQAVISNGSRVTCRPARDFWASSR